VHSTARRVLSPSLGGNLAAYELEGVMNKKRKMSLTKETLQTLTDLEQVNGGGITEQVTRTVTKLPTLVSCPTLVRCPTIIATVCV
jgi:hypothetical protein